MLAPNRERRDPGTLRIGESNEEDTVLVGNVGARVPVLTWDTTMADDTVGQHSYLYEWALAESKGEGCRAPVILARMTGILTPLNSQHLPT
jgi:hypothetical protein